MSHALVLVLALLLDAAMGEPEALWRRLPHPAVLLGRAVGWADAKLNHGSGRLVTGALALAGIVALAWGIGALIARLGWPFELIAAAVLLAHRSLVDHVRAVADALSLSLTDGRAAVGRIVGRDTGDMDEAAVARAAIESAAENLSDGVVAPAFWFLLLGLPGMLAYKAVNTADSMIGYRTPQHELFGKPAARLDDVLNWLPARITALFIYFSRPGRAGFAAIAADARLHRSPNAGWPESAIAQGLGVALAGPRSYHGAPRDYPWANEAGRRAVGPDEIADAVTLLWRAWGVALAVCIVIAIV